MIDMTCERTPEIVTAEIYTLHRQANSMMLQYVVQIGERLTELKGMVPYGGWGEYVEQHTPYSSSTASNFMRLYQEYGDRNLSLFGDNAPIFDGLDYTKALALLAVPKSERAEMAEEAVEKDYSTHKLREVIAERNAAREGLESAEKQIRNQQKEILETGERLKECEHALVDAMDNLKAAVSSRDEMERHVLLLNEQLKAEQDKPPVIVEKQVEVVKETISTAHQSLAVFTALFTQAQSIVNQMAVEISRLRKDGEDETAKKLGKALTALSDAVRKAAG